MNLTTTAETWNRHATKPKCVKEGRKGELLFKPVSPAVHYVGFPKEHSFSTLFNFVTLFVPMVPP